MIGQFNIWGTSDWAGWEQKEMEHKEKLKEKQDQKKPQQQQILCPTWHVKGKRLKMWKCD